MIGLAVISIVIGAIMGASKSLGSWKKRYRVDSVWNHMSPAEIGDWGAAIVFGGIVGSLLGSLVGGILATLAGY